MPLPISRNAFYELSLPCDEQSEPPTFRFRYLNGDESIEFARLFDEIIHDPNGAEAIESMYRLVRLPLIDWRGIVDDTGDEPVEIAYDPDAIKRLLSTGEAMRLAGQIMRRNVDIPFDDKKKSASPSPCDTACSANTAPARSNAATCPASNCPPNTAVPTATAAAAPSATGAASSR